MAGKNWIARLPFKRRAEYVKILKQLLAPSSTMDEFLESNTEEFITEKATELYNSDKVR